MIELAQDILEDYLRIRTHWESKITEALALQYGRLGELIFKVYGNSFYPDATGTLRLSYGTIKGYQDNSQEVPYETTLGGAFEKAEQMNHLDPWKLPELWHQKKDKLNLNVPFNFVSTNDIIGGNSGSPVLNKQGEIVGLIFDGNLSSLVGRYTYEPISNRAVSVSTESLLEVLKKVYETDRIVKELE